MQISIHGSGQEVGRSAIMVDDSKTRIMLDYGVKLNPEPPSYPAKPEKADAVILSHAHLDHSGALPVFYRKGKIPAFMTDASLDLAALLLKDSIKVAKKNGYSTPFEKNELNKMIRNAKLVRYNEKFRVNNFNCRLYDAGHIPGSAGTLLENRGRRIFYTGDIQTAGSRLLAGCRLPEKTDILITESTYSYRNHQPRENEEKRFIEMIEATIADEETALIPVFAVGRAQEILLILEEYKSKIAIDGMARKASEIIASYGAYLRDAKKLRSILKRIHFVTKESRETVVKKYPIVISSAGMLGGGPAINYLREISRTPESKVLFTGFLVEDSPGWNLIKTKVFENGEERFRVHSELQQINLSAHTDRSGLLDIIEKTKPETVICVHGEENNCREFARYIEEEKGISAYAPKNGETIKV